MLDPSRMPDDVQRDAAALLRELWQTFPKTMPVLTEPEEKPDEH